MDRDDWGRDPSVRYGREVFGSMEAAGSEVLARAGIGVLDPRLRRWRALALDLFQQGGWGSAGPGACGASYARCLVRVLEGSGVPVEGESAT